MSFAERADRSLYRGHRFPPEIIAHAVWLYFHFHLSLRDVQDLLAQARPHRQSRDDPAVVH